MTHWEVAVPFATTHGGQGTHYFVYSMQDCLSPEAAVRAAEADALSAVAVRHRRGGEIVARRSTMMARTPGLWFNTPADG